MFTTFFKMNAHPFSDQTTSEAICRDERLSEGLARLQFLADHASAALITGDEGVGKSSLIRLFINSLGSKQFRPVYIHLTHLKASAFLKLIVSSLGETPAFTKDRTLLQILNKTRSQDITTILLIDEAHLLDPLALIDLRLLLDDHQQLKIVLVGQPSLKKELKRSCHTALRQRIPIQYHIPPLSPSQTKAYILFHLKRVGSNDKLFHPDVIHNIHEHTRGVPRLINNLATALLITAASLKAQTISPELFAHTLSEFQLYA